jgi:hypothetical protein
MHLILQSLNKSRGRAALNATQDEVAIECSDRIDQRCQSDRDVTLTCIGDNPLHATR